MMNYLWIPLREVYAFERLKVIVTLSLFSFQSFHLWFDRAGNDANGVAWYLSVRAHMFVSVFGCSLINRLLYCCLS